MNPHPTLAHAVCDECMMRSHPHNLTVERDSLLWFQPIRIVTGEDFPLKRLLLCDLSQSNIRGFKGCCSCKTTYTQAETFPVLCNLPSMEWITRKVTIASIWKYCNLQVFF